MRKRERKFVVVFVLALALSVSVEVLKPETIDWTASYERDDTRPYGSLIAYDLLDNLFFDVRAVNVPPYLVVQNLERVGINYVFVTDVFNPDPVETEELLAFARRGNTVLVAAERFSGFFADTLRIHATYAADLSPFSLGGDDSLGVNLVNPALRMPEEVHFRQGAALNYFDHLDTLQTTVLGVNSRGDANFIEMDMGDGALYLSTIPQAFTNYHLVDGSQAAYLYRILSYLPDQDVLWDAYYKPQRVEVTTPLRFVLQDPSLKAAYWVLLTLVLLFILFEAKRKQRIIPVIAPLRNTTVEFVKTVGRLYFQHADHGNLAGKKITYFLDYIRQHLRLSTREIDDDFLERVAERSGVSGTEVRTLFAVIRAVQRQPKLSETELRRLSTAIDGFYRKSKR